MGGRPKEYDDTAVIDAAIEVFWTNGYEASSTQELCELTGLGRGSLYHAFGCKQKLYEQSLRRYQELGLKAQSELLSGPGSAKDRLRALLQWGIDASFAPNKRRSCMALFSIMELSSKNPVIDKINRAYVNKLEAVLCHVIAVGQRNGEISREQPALEVARAFLASYYGLRILGQSMPDPVFLDDVLEGTLARL
ncbi:TetR/AcrR family transcriptional regulator [Serratia fonticola]|uniref:TetR/AcrR family transcriptional regulator n=1 Tax=Serratia fonticola TaxID=47917 RepID=A0AAJ2D8E7_SERFO|nr:TetR/AcrR family transcriptional regulator [Serratia fonticola]MDQ9126158.1 TetR/AcrR family transcriptional regulator [Serratia fonticola]